jgi:signal transduction histidine kinase
VSGRTVPARAGPAVGVRPAVIVALGAAALAATGGAVYVIAVSRISPHPPTQAALVSLVSLTFVGAGIVALRLEPYARFGALLAAVGFTSLISVLHDANGEAAYAVGVVASNLVFAVVVHAILAFPDGRLGSRRARLIAAAAYIDVVVIQAVAVLFDPLTRYHSDHPPNALLVAARPTLATVLQEVEAGIAALIALAVVIELSRRARAATPAARRQLVPLQVGGWIALAFFVLGLALAPLSSTAGLLGFGLGLLAALAVPAAFLGVVAQGRLSRAAVGELLVGLRQPSGPPSLRDGLRRALGDPGLEVARARPEDGALVDRSGTPIVPLAADDPRTVTPVMHRGERIGALVHDRSLRLRPELLDSVSAAAGFALANERALATVQRVEARDRALLDAIPDLMLRMARDGTYLDIHADPSGPLGPLEDLIGGNVRDVVPPEVAEAIVACVGRALATGAMSSTEYTLEVGGTRRRYESRMVPSGADEVVMIMRDFTEQRRVEAEERRLAEEQAALRRVATLVASDPPPERVFQAVTEEVSRLLGLRTAVLHRFGEGRTSTIVGKFGGPTGAFEPGNVIDLEDGSALWVLETGAPARCDYRELTGPGAASLRALGFRSSVGVPISVGGVTWGALVAALREGETLPVAVERRLGGFAELVALAVASAQARDELGASRLRIVEAGDAERRRIERNLHDGAQQRLVALSLGLRVARAKLRSAPREAEELLEVAGDELAHALTELRELAQGIHPAVLTDHGLEAALDVLAARTPLRVALETRLPERLPEAVEATAYYVASEALANVVKHARAESVSVRAGRVDGCAVIEVEDDGTGRADPERGSGLAGLRDRVATLSGRFAVESAPGRGTLVRAELPVASRGAGGGGARVAG